MIPMWMTKQLIKSQDKYMRHLVNNPDFALAESKQLAHNKLHNILPFSKAGLVLELGCGPGKYLPMLASLGHTVIGVDPCEFPETWSYIRTLPGVEIKGGVFAENLPFADHKFDHVVCLGAVLYFADPIKSLEEMYRVLKPGGTLIIRTVNSNNPYTIRTGKRLDPASKNLYTIDELKDLVAKPGFKVINQWSFGYWPPCLTNFWWYLSNVWLTDGLVERLSKITKPANRVNNIVVACKQ